MMVTRKKRFKRVKGVATLISPRLKKKLDVIIGEYSVIGIQLNYAQASEIYMREK